MLDEENTSTAPPTASSNETPVRRTRRRAASRPAGPPQPDPTSHLTAAEALPATPAAADPVAATVPAGHSEAAPVKKTPAKRTTKKRASSTVAAGEDAPPVENSAAQTSATTESAEPAAVEKPKRKRSTKRAPSPAEATVPPLPELDVPAVDDAPRANGRSADLTAEPPAKSRRRSQFSASDKSGALKAESTGDAGSPVPLLFKAPDLAEPSMRRSARGGSDVGAGALEASQSGDAGAASPPAKPGDGTVPAAGDTGIDVRDAGDGQPSDDDEGGAPRRRRSRGGRNRRKSSGDADKSVINDPNDESPESVAASMAAASTADAVVDGDDTASADTGDKASDSDEGSGSSRRRRRRRRPGEDPASTPDDPADTVVRVRTPRAKKESISSVEGSTRIEAKKQRRREGRDAGRRRPPILSESEFLARRESVERVMAIRQRGETTQIAVLEDNVLVEHYVTVGSQSSIIGNVYLGRVQNVLPSMEAAFIDIGKGRNAVLYAGEVNWDLMGGGNQARRIENALKPGQPIMVQVSKDPIAHKGARLTSQISLPGRYLVYVPSGGTSGISRKLPDIERNRLKAVIKEILPEDAGVIIRTAAEGASEEELTRDVTRLTARWEDIEKKSKNGQAPQALYVEPETTLKVVRDLFTEDFVKLVISGDDAWDMVDGYVQHVAPDLSKRLERYEGDDVFTDFRVDEQIAKALERKVWLPSGGSLVIDRTEAMTVVDVNTGKFTGSGGNLEETVTKNNLEAAEEMVRQLRLRDIGGIIVVDFIDMVLENNRDLVLRRLVECLGRDRTRHQVAEVTSLGLVQMTRKRISTGLLEAFSHNCEHCQGRGVVVEAEPVEARKGDSGHSGAPKPHSDANPARSGSKRSSSRRRSGRRPGGEEDQAPDGDSSSAGEQDVAEEPAVSAGAAVGPVAPVGNPSSAVQQEAAGELAVSADAAVDPVASDSEPGRDDLPTTEQGDQSPTG